MVLEFKNLKINDLDSVSEFDEKVVFFLKEWFFEEKLVKVQTSGSTGKPKIFEIEKEKMLHSANMTCDFLDLKEGDTALLCLPVEYISGKMMLVRSFERNLNLIVSNPSINALDHLNEKIDFCAMTPLQIENSLDKLHLIHKIIIGGAAVSDSLKSKIKDVLEGSSTIIYETYGMSETLSHIALRQIFPVQEMYFKVFEGVDINVDERGCLTIFAPLLNSELLITNDMVEINSGNEFRYIGRVDNVINSGGAKIFPEQLEALVKKNIDQEVVFVGKSDEVLGQKLIAVVESEFSENVKKSIFSTVFEKSFHKPKDIIFLSEIPRTPNGKVNRLELNKIVDNLNNE